MSEPGNSAVILEAVQQRQFDVANHSFASAPFSTDPACQKYFAWKLYQAEDFQGAYYYFIHAGPNDGEAAFGVASVHIARKEFTVAISCLERSAELGYGRAFQWLGTIYQHGDWVPLDIDKAVHYYQLGASSGFVMARRSLIHIASRRSGFYGKCLQLLRLACLMIVTLNLTVANKNDIRLMDIKKAGEI